MNRLLSSLVLLGLFASIVLAENARPAPARKGPTKATYYTDSDCGCTFQVYGYDVNEETIGSCEDYPYLGTIEPGGRLTLTVGAGEKLWVRITPQGPCSPGAPSLDTEIPGGTGARYSYELSCFGC